MTRPGRMKWSGIPTRKIAELRPTLEGLELPDDGKHFGCKVPNILSNTSAIEFTAEKKHLRLIPVGVGADGKITKPPRNKLSALSANSKVAEFLDAYDIGIDEHIEVSQTHFKDIIRIGDMSALKFLPINAENVEIVFEIDTDFDLPDGSYGNVGKKKIGENIYLEQPKAWDSSQDNVIPVPYEIYTKGDKKYLKKKIPIEWLKAAKFPIFVDVDISWGSAVNFSGATSSVDRRIDGDYVDTDLFAIGYKRANVGRAIIGSAPSGANLVFGSSSDFVGNLAVPLPSLGIAALGTAKIMALFGNAGAGDDGFVRAVTLTGSPATTIESWGTAKEFVTSDIEAGMGACGLTTDVAGVTFNWEGGNDDMWHHVITASGTTLSSEDSGETSSWQQYSQWAKKLNATHFIIIGSGGGGVFVQVIEWDGATMSEGAVLEVFSSADLNTDKCAIAVLAEDKVVIFGGNNSAAANVGSEGIWARACTIDLTTHVITRGAYYEIDAQNLAPSSGCSDFDGCRAGDNDHGVIIYRDEDDSDKGKSRYFSVDWTDTPNLLITVGNADLMNDAATGNSSQYHHLVCVIDLGTYCTCSYCDDGDANDVGESRIGTYPAEGVTHEGAATLSGVGTLACIGQGILIGKATLSGTGILATIGQGIFIGKATLAGVGTLATIGRLIAIGKATLAGVGTLVVNGVATILGKATLAGVGSLTAKGSFWWYGAATLAGTGTLVAKGVAVLIGKATLAGVGTLATIGRLVAGGKATLSGTGTLATIGQGIFIGKATLVGVGTLATIGRIIAIGKATLAGVGTLVVSATVLKIWYGAATLSGVGTLAVKGVATIIGKATLSGVGTLAGRASVNYLRACTLDLGLAVSASRAIAVTRVATLSLGLAVTASRVIAVTRKSVLRLGLKVKALLVSSLWGKYQLRGVNTKVYELVGANTKPYELVGGNTKVYELRGGNA